MDEKQKNAPAVDAETLAAAVDAAVNTALDAALKAREEAREQEELKAKAAEADKLREELEALKAQTADAQPAKRLPGSTKEPEVHGTGTKAAPIEVGSKFDGLKAVDMAIGTMLHGIINPSKQYMRALAEKAVREGYLKADELEHTTNTGYGAEWAQQIVAGTLWRDTLDDNRIVGLFPQIQMPSSPFTLPASGASPDVYFVDETQDESELTFGSGNPIPDTRVGTAKAVLTAKKFGVRVGVSAELTEDAAIATLPTLREDMMLAMAGTLDSVLLNGDTTTAATGNINSDDAAPAAKTPYLAFDGLRKLPLVTNTANATDANGAVTLALMRTARFTMPVRYANDIANLAWIVDGETYAKLLSLDAIETMEKYGANATVLTGEAGRIDGIPIIVSAQAGLTEANGKMSATAANNTKGQMTLVYRRGWRVGFRRQLKLVSEYIAYTDSFQLVATVRMAFASFNTEVAAVLYNITV